MLKRRFVTLVLALAAVLFGAPAAASADIPQGGGADNVVTALTTADGSALVRSATQVTQVGGITVASQNLATAIAFNCTGCHSTAVAMQVVLVTGNPQFVTPKDMATSVNSGCHSCVAF